MNKLSFFALSLLFITQISLSDNTENTKYKVYKYLPMLNNDKISQNCSTVEPAWWRGDLECQCDLIEKNIENSATTIYIFTPDTPIMFNEKDEKNAIRIILADESVENKWEAYDKLQNLKTELHKAKIQKYTELLKESIEKEEKEKQKKDLLNFNANLYNFKDSIILVVMLSFYYCILFFTPMFLYVVCRPQQKNKYFFYFTNKTDMFSV